VHEKLVVHDVPVAMQLSPQTFVPPGQVVTQADPFLKEPVAQQIPSAQCLPEPHWASVVHAPHVPPTQACVAEHATHASRLMPHAAAFVWPFTRVVPLQQVFAVLPHVPPQHRAPAPPLQVLPFPASVQDRQTLPLPASSQTSPERQSVSALHAHLPPMHPKAPQFRHSGPQAVASVGARQMSPHA